MYIFAVEMILVDTSINRLETDKNRRKINKQQFWVTFQATTTKKIDQIINQLIPKMICK